MASERFFRRQSEKCAELAGRTLDQDSRERWERLRLMFCRLAEIEDRQTGQLSDGATTRPAA
jgi:hypothetical protein